MGSGTCRGGSQGWFSCVVPQGYNSLRFGCPFENLGSLNSLTMLGYQYRVCDEVLSCLSSVLSEGLSQALENVVSQENCDL